MEALDRKWARACSGKMWGWNATHGEAFVTRVEIVGAEEKMQLFMVDAAMKRNHDSINRETDERGAGDGGEAQCGHHIIAARVAINDSVVDGRGGGRGEWGC